MRPQPYFGITGFTHWQQVEAVFPQWSDRLIMVGALVSSKTLRGESNKWPKRYPKIEALKDVFTSYNKALNLVHYSTDEPGGLVEQLLEVKKRAGHQCHGFQLNVKWPSPALIETYRRLNDPSDGRNTIVLQCGPRAISEAGHNAVQIAERLKAYNGLVDYVLIDQSGGLGAEMNGMFVNKCFEAISEVLPDMGLSVGGGLCAENMPDKLKQLAALFEFSIDAEGRLRTKDDELNLEACKAYIQTAKQVFSRRFAR
jgi:phosphoribosylanthranilate isomerase